MKSADPGQHNALHVGFLPVGHKELRGQFGHLAHVIVTLFQAQTRKTQRRLSTASVLFGQVDTKLVKNFPVTALDGAVETAVTVHDDKAKGFVVHEEFVASLPYETCCHRDRGRC